MTSLHMDLPNMHGIRWPLVLLSKKLNTELKELRKKGPLNKRTWMPMHICSNSSKPPFLFCNDSTAETNRKLISPEEYRAAIRGLNSKQRQVVMFHRAWCKHAVTALKNGKPVNPYRVFVSGPGGVGKSHVISIIRSDTVKLLRLSGQLQPEDVIALLTAPTGSAAFNIVGMTLHSGLLLSTSTTSNAPLTQDRLIP